MGDLHLPPPFVCPTEHLDGVTFGWQVGEAGAEALGLSVPADDQPQTQEVSIHLPVYYEIDPLTFGELGMDGLEWLVA